MENLIEKLAKSIQTGHITSNLRYKPNEELINASKTLAKLLKDNFFDNSLMDVYPYSIMLITLENPSRGLYESYYLIGFKGRSIEYESFKANDTLKDYIEDKLRNIEHSLYDEYDTSTDRLSVPTFEYKRKGMKRKDGDFEKELGRLYDSAFIMLIPII